jgi:hypothetical protein
MLNVTIKLIALSVDMLSVVVLNVVAFRLVSTSLQLIYNLSTFETFFDEIAKTTRTTSQVIYALMKASFGP